MASSAKLESTSINLTTALANVVATPMGDSAEEVTVLLEACRQALRGYIQYSNTQFSPESEAFVSRAVGDRIDEFLKNLSDNFFPMSHLNKPLSELQIVDKMALRAFQEHAHRTFVGAFEDLLAEWDRLTHP